MGSLTRKAEEKTIAVCYDVTFGHGRASRMGTVDIVREEESLTAAALDGDGDALAVLLRRCDDPLRVRLDQSIGPQYRSAFDLADVLQVTYLEAFLTIRRFSPNGPGSFLSWLTTIAENNVADAIRGLNRGKRPPPGRQVASSLADDSYVMLLTSMANRASTPSRHFSKQEAATILNEAIEKLPPVYRTVIRLCDLKGLPAGEAAAAMERSTPAVYMLHARAHDHLLELLGSGSGFFSGVA